MAQNSSSIPGFLDTKPRWLIFIVGVVLGMALIWSLFIVDFGELGFLSASTANETAVTTSQYENWQPYSHLGVPGLENSDPEQIPTYFDWESYSNLGTSGIDQ